VSVYADRNNEVIEKHEFGADLTKGLYHEKRSSNEKKISSVSSK